MIKKTVKKSTKTPTKSVMHSESAVSSPTLKSPFFYGCFVSWFISVAFLLISLLNPTVHYTAPVLNFMGDISQMLLKLNGTFLFVLQTLFFLCAILAPFGLLCHLYQAKQLNRWFMYGMMTLNTIMVLLFINIHTAAYVSFPISNIVPYFVLSAIIPALFAFIFLRFLRQNSPLKLSDLFMLLFILVFSCITYYLMVMFYQKFSMYFVLFATSLVTFCAGVVYFAFEKMRALIQND